MMGRLVIILFTLALLHVHCCIPDSVHAGFWPYGKKRAAVPLPPPLPSSRFTVSGACVTDNRSRLMWSQQGNLAGTRTILNRHTPTAVDMMWCRNGCIPSRRTWEGALEWVAVLNSRGGLCGYTNWRIPTLEELFSLVNRQQPDSARWLNSQGFNNVVDSWYWASTPYNLNSDYAWFVNMSDGYVGIYEKLGNYLYVLPVRSEQ